MTTNITSLPTRKSRPLRQAKPRPAKASRTQHAAAIAVAGVTAVLMGLSLAHLAHGIGMVSGSSSWEAWSMAIGIDLGFVASELAPLCAATAKARAVVAAYARPTVVGTVAISAALNATAFGTQAVGWWQIPAIALGLVVPGLIFCLSRIAFGLAASK